MSISDHPGQNPTKQPKVLPLWLAYPLALFVWCMLPWAISNLGHRYGWHSGRSGIWNLLGLIPVLVGVSGLIWGLSAHRTESPKGVNMEPDKDYLLRNSLYAYSRNPMYLSELILMLGWVIFYGSAVLLIAFVAWALFFNFYQAPLEKRILEAHFDESYREYKRRVPRWFGRIRKRV